MTYKAFTDALAAQIKGSTMGSKFKSGFFNLGLPGTLYPCVTLDGITDLNDKLGKHTAVITFWNKDTSLQFLDDAQTFKKILQSAGVEVITAAHRPSATQEINKMVYVVSFYP